MDLLNNFQTDSFHEEINGESFLDIKETYQKFIDEESKENPTFAFWSSYLEIVQTLLCFIRWDSNQYSEFPSTAIYECIMHEMVESELNQ